MHCYWREDGYCHIHHPEVFYLYVFHDTWFTGYSILLCCFLDECKEVYTKCTQESTPVFITSPQPPSDQSSGRASPSGEGTGRSERRLCFQKKILFALLMNKWFPVICKNILFGYFQCTTSSLKKRRKGGRLYRRSQPY